MVTVASGLSINMKSVEAYSRHRNATAGIWLGGILSSVMGINESSIRKDHEKMVKGYFDAAYYSNKAAIYGSRLLERYGAEVEQSAGVIFNAGSDNGRNDVYMENNKLKLIEVKTNITDFAQFVEQIPDDDVDAVEFKRNNDIKNACFSEARSATASLIAKRLLIGNVADSIGHCIADAIAYQSVRTTFESQSGTSMGKLSQVIEEKFSNVKVSKEEIKKARESVPRG